VVILATLCVSRASNLVGVTRIRGPHDVGAGQSGTFDKATQTIRVVEIGGNSEGRIRKPNHE